MKKEFYLNPTLNFIIQISILLNLFGASIHNIVKLDVENKFIYVYNICFIGISFVHTRILTRQQSIL